mgnify:CR=1 FL=1|tara:strand:+ start:891 stop:1472 length:582 start_codon:yes stop_codon:yes gene_type:complete
MIFEVSYSFLTGVIVSGIAFYHYRETIVPNIAWILFKMQANWEIVNKDNSLKESIYVTLKDGEIINSKDKLYDLMIYGKVDEDNIYHYYLYDENNNLYNDTSEVSYKFISCEINYNSESYVVKLNSSEQNFYYEKNIILSKSFVYWYLEKFYNVKCKGDYTITIIDNNISEVSLSSENNIKGLRLDMDSYSIL